MSDTLAAVQRLVAAGEVKISEHGYDELAEDRISAKDIIGGVHEATVVEDYPTFPKGRSVLVLQSDGNRQPVHVVWGIPQGTRAPRCW